MKRLSLLFFFVFAINVFCYAISSEEISLIIQTSDIPLEIVRHFIPENPQILEAGGNRGEDTVKMIHFWPTGRIFVFEPNPETYTVLHDNIIPYPNIQSYPMALYNYDGTTSFNIQLAYGNNGASSILPAGSIPIPGGGGRTWQYTDKQITVPCITLDSWAQNNGVTWIDFLWLDMEGAELYVLKAAPMILKSVKAIYTETNFREFRIGMTQYSDLAQFLQLQGFVEIFHKYDRECQGDAIFVRRELIND